MIHAYCIRYGVDPAPDAGLVGIDGAEVCVLRTGKIGLWVSESAGSGVSIHRLREHDKVVTAALTTATPLPVRFGTCFRDEASALGAMAQREADFLADLARVAGCVEMGVRVGWQVDDEPTCAPNSDRQPTSGTEYLEMRRLRANRVKDLKLRAAEVLTEIEKAMQLEGVPVVRSILPVRELAGILAHLVQRTEIGSYRAAVDAAKSITQHLTLATTGPWAPYSFVGADGGYHFGPTDT
ncbi:MAG TPA: GvpL/GvpF family gas vesicle protein [Longimicrobiaceae bacterium]|nr:GvpL/GvpF family gas vesicle protein [Longimicrobiaceae bacterium]